LSFFRHYFSPPCLRPVTDLPHHGRSMGSVLKRVSGSTVKNGKEAYLDCLSRCARGLRCRRSGDETTRSRQCALCAATSDRMSGRRSIWIDIMRRRQGRAKHRT
jgi:hypothetical protein